MSSWIFNMVWVRLGFVRWFSSFSRSERVALFAAFLVLICELKALEESTPSRLKRCVKRTSVLANLLRLKDS